MNTLLNTKVLIQQDTKENWILNNPVLWSGEFGFETDTLQIKVGDGATAWNDLPYITEKELPSGGFKGQFLAKNSNLDYDLIWADGGNNTDLINSGVEFSKIKVTDVLVPTSIWKTSVLWPGYGYSAFIPINGVLAEMTPLVTFYPNEAGNGNMSHIVRCMNGGIEIYCQEIPEIEFSIATVVCFREKPESDLSFSITFDTLDGLITYGVWDKALRKLYC